MRLAGRWSQDPTKLDASAVTAPGLGFIALAPAGWRPERLRKAG